MRVLLDTNILIHREAATVVRDDIGLLFQWLDTLKFEKCFHPASRAEIEKHRDSRVRDTFKTKLQAYRELQTSAPIATMVEQFAATDKTENDRNDTLLINEVFSNRVDYLISEDRGLHAKAAKLFIADRVFTIDAFLEKAIAENPALVDYKNPAVRKVVFGQVDLKSGFFDTFRQDYAGFDIWFSKKSDEPAYVCYEGTDIVAFLYLKAEGTDENYGDIEPRFKPKRRLKIGTFKVELNGYKLGERFLKIVFDNAIRQTVDEIYVTIFPKTFGQERLVKVLEDFGFGKHGIKTSANGTEAVYVRGMTPRFDTSDPKVTFPYVSRSSRAFIVPIKPEFHTSLLPDSILNTENPADFGDQESHRNAIRKVYVGRSHYKSLQKGDTIVFYRTGGYHKSVVTTVGIVDGVYNQHIKDEAHFISLCRKRSVFTDAQLSKLWSAQPNNRPFIVGFLYAYSFLRRPNMKELIDNGIIRDVSSAPRGFERLTPEQFAKVLELSKTNMRIIVD